MTEREWPYNLPIWRRFHRAASPDGKLVARIDPAYEVSMGNPTSGMLCLSNGLHIERCNPSFVWSDDSRYLAVPRYFGSWFRRQRLLVIDFADRIVYASSFSAHYYQPESFTAGRLVVAVNPFRSQRLLEIEIPNDLGSDFSPVPAAWPEM
ncbi:MAG TPA: hypothetical protein VFR31_19545 [Thermoanaerobaculia bacterium]|nr:hypothetical protein [Thermoanaerobaculia bacterium]